MRNRIVETLVNAGCGTAEHCENLTDQILAVMHDPSQDMMDASKTDFANVDGIISYHFARSGGDGLTWKDGKPPLWHGWNSMIDYLKQKARLTSSNEAD